VFQYPLQMELSQPARGPIIASIEQTSRRRRDAFPQKIFTETHVTVLPRHTLSSSPSGLSKTILCRDRGAVEPLATGLPRLGALSVHGR
jgi:hypothetical protein